MPNVNSHPYQLDESIYMLGGVWAVFLIFIQILIHFFKQTVLNLIRRRVLRRLIWFCAVCRCPTKKTLTKNEGTLVFLQELSVVLQEEWQQILKAAIRRIIASMLDRCRACVAARGGHIPIGLGLHNFLGKIKYEIQRFP